MIENFEIKCLKCGNVAVDTKGTSINYGETIGAAVRVKFTCLTCGNESEVTITQVDFYEFQKDPHTIETELEKRLNAIKDMEEEAKKRIDTDLEEYLDA